MSHIEPAPETRPSPQTPSPEDVMKLLAMITPRRSASEVVAHVAIRIGMAAAALALAVKAIRWAFAP